MFPAHPAPSGPHKPPSYAWPSSLLNTRRTSNTTYKMPTHRMRFHLSSDEIFFCSAFGFLIFRRHRIALITFQTVSMPSDLVCLPLSRFCDGFHSRQSKTSNFGGVEAELRTHSHRTHSRTHLSQLIQLSHHYLNKSLRMCAFHMAHEHTSTRLCQPIVCVCVPSKHTRRASQSQTLKIVFINIEKLRGNDTVSIRSTTVAFSLCSRLATSQCDAIMWDVVRNFFMSTAGFMHTVHIYDLTKSNNKHAEQDDSIRSTYRYRVDATEEAAALPRRTSPTKQTR